jgi:hypothetical protein
MTPMHLQLVSDANGEWAAGLPAARVDPGDTEEMVVVVVVVVVVVGGGAGGGGAMGRALRRAEVAARVEPKRLCVALHTRGGLRFVATGWGSSTPSTPAPPSVADPPPPHPPTPPSFPLPPPLKQMELVYMCTLKVANAIAVVVFV